MSEVNPEIKNLLAQLDEQKEVEAKLSRLIEFMEASLSQSGTPRFKNFWEARRLSLDMFKEVTNPQVRADLWNRYSELSKEARRLKDLLDEESAFNVEQIEIAITSLELESQKESDPEVLMSQAPQLQLPLHCHTLETELVFYAPRQAELNLLNAYASRINALRKELIKTEMRIRQKNKFFQRLSQAGDFVFPRRKLLIEEVSQKFKQDVKDFIAHYLAKGIRESHFFLRDEIKGLQGAAKVLTLSAEAFKETRLELSQAWDTLKAEEKDLKKHRQEQKEVFKANAHLLEESLKGVVARFEAKELTSNAASKELEHFQHDMRNTELGRDEVKYLREELEKARQIIDAELIKEEQERAREAQEKELERKAKVQGYKDRIQNLLKDAMNLELPQIEAERKAIQEEIANSAILRSEKLELEKAFKPLKDVLSEKNEKRLLDLPENDRQALEQLKELLKDRKARRQETKDLVDELRKNEGLSGFDFVKALELSEQLKEEKQKLDKLNAGVKELEEKIAVYQKK